MLHQSGLGEEGVDLIGHKGSERWKTFEMPLCLSAEPAAVDNHSLHTLVVSIILENCY